MQDRTPSPNTLVRTFADPDTEYVCVALAMPPSSTAGWTVRVEANVVDDDGVIRSMEPATSDCPTFDHCPTGPELHRAISDHLGDRIDDTVETTALTTYVEDLLKEHLAMVGRLTRNHSLEVAPTLHHASYVARVLTFDHADLGEKVVLASVLVGLASGAHTEPPPKWSHTPAGQAAADVGLI